MRDVHTQTSRVSTLSLIFLLHLPSSIENHFVPAPLQDGLPFLPVWTPCLLRLRGFCSLGRWILQSFGEVIFLDQVQVIRFGLGRGCRSGGARTGYDWLIRLWRLQRVSQS